MSVSNNSNPTGKKDFSNQITDRGIGISKRVGLFSRYSTEGTEFKTLDYKDYLPATSKAPYITKDINTGETVDKSSWLSMYAKPLELEAMRRVDDTVRITKFIGSAKGILWESRMAGLETIQQNLQKKRDDAYDSIQTGTSSSPNFWGKIVRTLGSVATSVVRGIGLTASTLAQTAASGTGYHHDTYISRAYLYQEGGAKAGILNSLLASAGISMGRLNAAGAIVGGAKTLPDPHIADGRQLVNPNGTNGPFGTIQKKSTNSTKDPKVVAKTYEAEDKRYIKQQGDPLEPVTLQDTGKVQDLGVMEQRGRYLEGENPKVYIENSKEFKYSDSVESKETAFGRLHTGSRDKVGDFFEVGVKSNTIQTPEEEEAYSLGGISRGRLISRVIDDPGKNYTKDTLEFERELVEEWGFIPFCITTITPDHRTYLNFPAYLDSYDDTYNGEWESVRYVGRAENFYGYKGFTRNINLSFKVIAANRTELVPIYKKLNRLAGATAPSYGPTGLFMRGTLASLTIGELLKEQLGIIPNIKITWQQDYLWELGEKIAMGEYTTSDGKSIRVPHMLDISMQFIPIEKQEAREDYGAYFVFDPEERKTNVKVTEQPASTKEVIKDKDAKAGKTKTGEEVPTTGLVPPVPPLPAQDNTRNTSLSNPNDTRLREINDRHLTSSPESNEAVDRLLQDLGRENAEVNTGEIGFISSPPITERQQRDLNILRRRTGGSR